MDQKPLFEYTSKRSIMKYIYQKKEEKVAVKIASTNIIFFHDFINGQITSQMFIAILVLLCKQFKRKTTCLDFTKTLLESVINLNRNAEIEENLNLKREQLRIECFFWKKRK